MVWILGILTLTGINFALWLIIGLIRYIYELIIPPIKQREPGKNEIEIKDVAAVVPAHNEEETIQRALQALLKILPPNQIYVANDFSSDKTLELAYKMGVRALDIKPNRGKARSLVYIMNEYNLLNEYKAIIINDADCEIDKNYLKYALPYFNDKEIAAIAPHGVTRWKNYRFFEEFFIAYRIRLWRIIQVCTRFGQTWKFTNVSFIIPGSLPLYRTSVLKNLEIDAPGLIIEDFNMTFEVHKKKLGKIAYHPKIFGFHQDPHSLPDYIKQVQRWNVGFWQTVKRHGVWPSFFWLSTGSFIIEFVLFSLFTSLLPVILGLFIANSFQPIDIFHYTDLKFTDLLIGVFAADYILTLTVAILERKPIMLVFGLGFIFLRYIDSVIYLGSIIEAFTRKSSGTWESPKRRKNY